MKISIVGSGNVATVMGRTIKEAGHEVLQVISRNLLHAEKLAVLVGATATVKVQALHPQCDFCIIAVGDSNIQLVANQLPVTNAVVVHTAGSVERDVLLQPNRAVGVIYPLQSLRSLIADLPKIPVLIDGVNSEVITRIRWFAETWASGVWQAGDEKRQQTHVAAVILNNFINHLVSLTHEYCNKENIDFEILKPLLKQTVTNLTFYNASELQTGPARRNDISTIKKHLLILNKQPVLRSLYLKLSESIINQQNLLFKNN